MDFDKREDVSKEYTWNLTTRYKTDKAWEKEYDALRKDVHIMEFTFLNNFFIFNYIFFKISR